jgi:hypothetical protein
MRPTPKRLTTQVSQLDIGQLRGNGWLLPGFACRRANTVAISWRGVVSSVHLIPTATPFGGQREWFACPACGQRAGILYEASFACRTCCRLNYPSTRQSTRDRAITRAVQLRRRLGGDGSLLEPFPGPVKGMKRKTWWRLYAKGRRDEQRGLIGMEAAVASLTAKLEARRPDLAT